MGIELVVAPAQSHDHNLLPPVKKVEVIPLSAMPQGCSDEGLLFLEGAYYLHETWQLCLMKAFSNIYTVMHVVVPLITAS